MAGETLNVDKVPTPVARVAEKDLRWYAEKCRNAKLQDIARRELARRSGGAAAAAPQPSQAIARQQHTPGAIEGNFRDPNKATAALKEAAEAFHLVSPAPMVGALPEGCAVALALVRISPDDPHLYKVGDKMALDKTHLSTIANAIGASTVYSRRTDDGSHPHYCSWTVKVRFRQFDGTWLSRQGSVEMDVREPFGAEYVDAVRKAEKAGRDATGQLGELRRFIARHAESKALNRAYAALGIRRSYTRAELERPFCVARIVFTGQSDDPAARAQFREGIMNSFLGSSEDAFGPADQSQPMEQLASPPPPALADYSEPPTYDAEGEEYPAEPAPPPAPRAQPAPAPAASQPPAPAQQPDERGDNPEDY
jgi:hypothetical protein